MRLILLTALVMVAFAANSVLNRAALSGGAIGAGDFAAIRLASGAAALCLLVALRDRGVGALAAGGWRGAAALGVYVIGFSLAYRGLDAGVGALILFGGVQVTMFAAAAARGDPLPPTRWLGAALALAGLAWMLWPAGAAAPSWVHGLAMTAAAVGWGAYSILGQGARDPLAATAANFALAAPAAVLLTLLLPAGAGASAAGVGLAVLSGVATSGLAYALWYAVLPRLATSVAALAQLTVPVIAAAGGALLLAEAPTLRLILASAVVLGGVALGIAAPQRRSGSSAS
ncbi:DMT family transporter [Rhodobacteraceae bacterium CCMM004]|nr:DMT family transporter [Rhodobacteraceae bacterium CCMM004]